MSIRSVTPAVLSLFLLPLDAAAQAVYTWNQSAAGQSWFVPANWTGGPAGTVPGNHPRDLATFDRAVGTASPTITMPGGVLSVSGIRTAGAGTGGPPAYVIENLGTPGTLRLNASFTAVGGFPNVVLGAETTPLTVRNGPGGALTVELATAGPAVVYAAGSVNISANVIGPATAPLHKEGGGLLILTGANTYQGGTVINAGWVYADTPAGVGSATGTGPVTVNTGATLGGLGRIDGAVTVNTGGWVYALDWDGVVGTLTVNNTVAINGRYSAFVGGNFSSRLIHTGTLTLGAGSELSVFSGSFFNPGTTYTITSGPHTGRFASVTGVPGTHSVDYSDPTAVRLTPVPEPGWVFGMAAAGLGLFRLARRSPRRRDRDASRAARSRAYSVN
jgi:autotransporter-associated beta strand protein